MSAHPSIVAARITSFFRAQRKRERVGHTMKPAPRTVQAKVRPIADQLWQLLRADASDKGAWEKIAAADLHVRIGNTPTAISKDAALSHLEQFLSRVESIGEGFCAVWQRQETVFAETEVRFVDAARRPRCIPCTIVARVTQGCLCDLRFYLDPSPIP